MFSGQRIAEDDQLHLDCLLQNSEWERGSIKMEKM